MKIRYYFLIGLVYIILVLCGVYYITDAKYELKLSTIGLYDINLSAGLWVSIILIVLFIVSLIFMFLMALKFKFSIMKHNRDVNKIIAQIKDQMHLNESKSYIFSSKNFKELHDILSRFYIFPNLDSKDSNNEKIDDAFKVFNQVKNGEVVEFKNLHLAQNHPISLENLKNMSLNSPNNAIKVIEQNISAFDLLGSYSIEEIYHNAYKKLIESNNVKALTKAINERKNTLSFAIIKDIIIYQANSNALKESTIIELLKDSNLNAREFLDIALNLAKYFKEENISFWLNIFDILSKTKDTAIFAYFYILLEVGKTDEAKDLKAQFPKNDYLSVSAFDILKDKGYPLLLFFDPLVFMDNKNKDSSIV